MNIKTIFILALLFSPLTHADESCKGDELKLSFRSIQLKAVFAILADFSGNKLKFDQSIAWSGPININCTSWHKIARDLARQHNLTLEISNETISVSR